MEVDNQMDNKDYFFCYNKKLFDYLTKEKSLDFITIAINPTTKKTFSMFKKTNELQKALNDYKKLQKS